MSRNASHNHRRKTIRQFKKKFGSKWLPQFQDHCDQIAKAQDGPCLGTLADLISPHASVGELATAYPVSAVVSP